jgi:hypothetical protein
MIDAKREHLTKHAKTFMIVPRRYMEYFRHENQ